MLIMGLLGMEGMGMGLGRRIRCGIGGLEYGRGEMGQDGCGRWIYDMARRSKTRHPDDDCL